MKKFYTFNLLFFSFFGILNAQLTPEFEFKLYFEDAKSNLDSIILGYDSTAGPTIDPEFGEMDITDLPFNSSLEVRGSLFSYNQSKIFIDGYRQEICDMGRTNYLNVDIYSKNYPITMRWDSSLFLFEECRVWSHFTRDLNNSLGIPIVVDGLHLLNQASQFIIDEDYINYTKPAGMNSYVHDVEGIGKDTIQSIFFGFGKQAPFNVSVNELDLLPFSLFPNPASNQINIEFPENFSGSSINFQIFDALGRIIREAESFYNNDKIEVGTLKSGIYYLKIFDESKLIGIEKFMKI